MNKLFKKIGGAILGLALSIGVGVAVASSKEEALRLNAESGSVTLNAQNFGVTGTSYSSYTYQTDGVTFKADNVNLNNSTVNMKASTGAIYNSTAFTDKRIVSIQISGIGFSSSSNAGFTVYGGNSSKATTTTFLTNTGSTANVTVNFTNYDYTYFYVKNGSTRTARMNIVVNYEDVVTYATTIAIAKHADSETPAISNKIIEIEKGAGDGSYYEKLTATPTGPNSSTPTLSSVNWANSDTNSSFIDEWNAADNSVEFMVITTEAGTFTVTADANGAETAHSVTDTITYRIIDSSAPVLNRVEYTGTPVGPQYSGKAFNFYGLEFKAVYVLNEEESKFVIGGSDINWNILVEGNVATGTYTDETGTTVDVSVSVEVLANTVTINIGGDMTKKTYTTSDSWNPAGLTRSALYADGTEIADDGLEWVFSPETPAAMAEAGSGRVLTVKAKHSLTETESAAKNITVILSIPQFVKVTTAPTDWSGTYAIVYEDGQNSVALDSSLETLDSVENTQAVLPSSNSFSSSSPIIVTITSKTGGYSIKTSSNLYFGNTSDSNALATSETDSYTNTISLDNNGNAVIISGGSYLRYNSSSNQIRFRYYKSSSYTGQKAIQLYRLDTITPWINEYMHMSDSNYEGDGNGYCLSQGTYLSAKQHLVTQSEVNLTAFRNDEESRYTSALDRYNHWATAAKDTKPFEGDQIYNVANINSLDIKENSTLLTTLIIVVSLTSIAVIGGYVVLRKRKHN